MTNTNFQTIHQMGNAISDFVKQATGRDAVQNIDMDHVTVAQNRYYADVDVSGRMVSFDAGAAGIPFETCIVKIEPVQDLHGYDSPWPAGGGKNLLDIEDYTLIHSSQRTKGVQISNIPFPGTFTLSIYVENNTATRNTAFTLRNTQGSDYIVLASITVPAGATGFFKTTFTLTTESIGYLYSYLSVQDTDDASITITNIQLERGSSATEYQPYANICPITGWTMCNIYQSGQNPENVTVYRITFPSEAGTVYSGMLDVKTGLLNVNMTYKQMTFDWINTRDSNSIGFQSPVSQVGGNSVWVRNWNYAEAAPKRSGGIKAICNAFPISMHNTSIYASQYRIYFGVGSMTTVDEFKASVEDLENSGVGLWIAYELATPLTYQLTPTEITTLLGQNTIWADTGDISIKFTDVKELY